MQVLKLYMDLQVYMQVFYMPCNKACIDGFVGGVEACAIGCWHAVAETGISSSSTCTLLVAVSTQDL
jgi:hypothetical protein